MRKILVIDLNFKKNSIFKNEFVMPIIDILKEENYQYDMIHFLDEYDPTQYSKIILGGVALKDFEYIKSLKSFLWIKDYDKPIFGICAGGQIISLIFNSNLIENFEVGLINVRVVKDDRILESLNEEFEVYSLHKKGIGCGENFIEIISNQKTQLMKHKEKEIYSCIFHPEVRNKIILRNFLKL